jgi:hypothetical protein
MAELYSRRIDETDIRCYSERGLMAYFMLHVLPQPRKFEDFISSQELDSRGA